jgi:hypothetical protein
MEWARSSRRRAFTVQRASERSRIQHELIVAAYELAAPLVRGRLSAPNARAANCDRPHNTRQSADALEGVRA